MEQQYQFVHHVARAHVLGFKSLSYLQFLWLIAKLEGGATK